MKNKHTQFEMNRREALGLGAAAAAAVVLGQSNPISAAETSGATNRTAPATTGPGHIVKVHMPGMRQGLFPHPDAARTMVNAAVTTLTRKKDPVDAWRMFVKPTDRVGVKVNCLGTRMISTMKEVTDAVVENLIAAGVPESNIVVIDMFASNMMGGRYEQRTNPNKVRVLAHKDVNTYGDWITAGNARVRFTTLFTECDSVINMPVLKDHDLAGVTCCMKNITYGLVEKPHVNHETVNDALCHIWALEQVRSRVKLNLIDGSTILYDGGPKYNRAAHLPHECIYATTDPVAMDTVVAELVEGLRAENGLRPLAEVKRPPLFLEKAAAMGLGITDSKLIRLETIELPPFAGGATS